jgi:hypothetical protein
LTRKIKVGLICQSQFADVYLHTFVSQIKEIINYEFSKWVVFIFPAPTDTITTTMADAAGTFWLGPAMDNLGKHKGSAHPRAWGIQRGAHR